MCEREDERRVEDKSEDQREFHRMECEEHND